MRDVLFLTCFMKHGYGVSVVLDIFARQLAAQGVRAAVAALDSDDRWTGFPVYPVDRTVASVRDAASRLDNPLLVAVTTPFFEMIRELSATHDCWAWEMGDPTPGLFPDRQAREDIIKNKKVISYPYARGLFVLSHFLKAEIGQKHAVVIHLGCDHMPDLGTKGLAELPAETGRPLRVGTLMRFGKGEAFYKGGHLYLKLIDDLEAAGADRAFEFHAAGAGTAADAGDLAQRGLATHLNLTDEEKAAYLRSLDVFISFSLWEGFNLPLVEAQALGTVALAFDTGAHPEVTPFVCRDVNDIRQQLLAFAGDRAHLLRCSAMAYRFVRQRFNWAAAVGRMAACLER
jgi:glycosyltransferase involved in cell wall biosynthesis